MKKAVFIILGLGLFASSAFAKCVDKSDQAITVLKQFDARVSEQSHATVKFKKDGQLQSKEVSLGELLGIMTQACGGPGSASMKVLIPGDSETTNISFSKRGDAVFATSNNKSTKVSL